jgi:(E)-4-hydroxy-3-methylbut-2-enyl-diphosphate synthase
VAPVYVDGEKTVTLKGDHIAAEFTALVDDYVRTRFGEGGARRRELSKTKTIQIKPV